MCKLDVYEEAARFTKRQRTELLFSGRFSQGNIMKMNDIDICNLRGNPPSNLEDVTNTSGLEMKEHLCISLLDAQVCV